MIVRPRRLRGNETLRKMVRETRLDKSSLVYPVFIKDGDGIMEELPTMTGQYCYSVDKLPYKLEQVVQAGVGSVMLFGIPELKDEQGSQAYAEDGIAQRAIQEAKRQFPDLYLISDVCLCEYTSHGHCGILEEDRIDNDSTLKLLAKAALSQVQAGADMVAPSDMMDGRVLAIRKLLDEKGYEATPIMSYAVKYASAFGKAPRPSAGYTPACGDRMTYEMDYHNRKEGIKEAILDVEEGADILMVKPALSYLDMIREITDHVSIPVAAYSVSGEYAMVKAAARLGYIDQEKILCEMTASTFRAGASVYLSYFAEEIAGYLDKGLIG